MSETGAGYLRPNRQFKVAQEAHRKEYASSVESGLGEISGPNSYPVPWMWTDIYRHAPSELFYVGGVSDDDYESWRENWPERWASSCGARVDAGMRRGGSPRRACGPRGRGASRSSAAPRCRPPAALPDGGPAARLSTCGRT